MGNRFVALRQHYAVVSLTNFLDRVLFGGITVGNKSSLRCFKVASPKTTVSVHNKFSGENEKFAKTFLSGPLRKIHLQKINAQVSRLRVTSCE